MTTGKKPKLELFEEFRSGRLDRREFLRRLALLSAAGLLPVAACTNSTSQTGLSNRLLTRRNRKILETVQDHLFPHTEDAPGARDLNAASYLIDFVLSDFNNDPEEREFILSGPGRLETACYREKGQSFLKLDETGREEMLQIINEYIWGERWLSLLLLYIFEALLADPIYGGNPNEVGWKWLEHTPGYPRPDEKNRYWMNPHGN